MKKKKNEFILFSAISFFCLVAGASVYIFALEENSAFFFRILRNYGPDFLWLLSFEFALAPIFKELFPKKYLLITFIICTLTGTAFEILQKLNFFKGTGDIYDVSVYFTAALLGCRIIKTIYKKEGKEK